VRLHPALRFSAARHEQGEALRVKGL
jgi:hypothetical protein